MKPLAFVLALAFGGLQTVAFTDCCCDVVCAHQQGLKQPRPGKAAPSESQGCCDVPSAPAPGNEAGCIHLQPSPDVLAASTAVEIAVPMPFFPPVLWVLSTAPESPVKLPVPARPARGRPIFLLDAALLI